MYPFNNPQFPYPVYTNSFPPQVNTNPRLICKQVGSIDEARSAIIDPFSLFLFVDFSTGKIYVKKMGDNGQSEFYSYVQEATPAKTDPMEEIRQMFANIESRLGGNNEQSIPDAAGAKESNASHNKSTGRKNETSQS